MGTAVRPFRFGVSFAGPQIDPTIVDRARRLEDLGYAVFSCPDHLDFPDSTAEPMVLLGAVAAATSTIELQPLVLACDFRHPALLARQAAVLDQLSGGRFCLGMGAGWYAPEFHSAGIDFRPPGVRIDRLREAVQVIRGLHTGDMFSFEGRHFHVRELAGRPVPLRNPMPLLVGGSGPRMLALACEIADTIALTLGLHIGSPLPDSDTPYAQATDMKIHFIREALAAGAPCPELQTTVFTGGVTDADPLAPLAPLAQLLNVPASKLEHCPHVLSGSVQHCIEMIEGWRERWGISYITLPENRAVEFAPVVAALAGK